MPDESVNVTVALPVAAHLAKQIAAVSRRVRVVELTRAQRLVYRDGRPLWAGYQEPPAGDDEDEEVARERLGETLSVTEVLLTNPIVPDDILGRAPELRLMQLTSAGVDRLIDSEVVRADGVSVTTASGLHATPISEYVLGAMIAFAKGLPRAIRAQEERQWRPFWPQELEGATVAVLGLGAIGHRVAELSKALGMRVLGVRRSAEKRLSGAETGDPAVHELYRPADLHEVLAQSDYVVLAVPLTAESHHMIGEPELRAMKPNAVIVNIARGGVIDQPALVRALNGRLDRWARRWMSLIPSRCRRITSCGQRRTSSSRRILAEARRGTWTGRSTSSATTCGGTWTGKRCGTWSTRTAVTDRRSPRSPTRQSLPEGQTSVWLVRDRGHPQLHVVVCRFEAVTLVDGLAELTRPQPDPPGADFASVAHERIY